MNEDERKQYVRAAIDEMQRARGKPATVKRESREEALETRNRALTATLQAQAKRIQSLECRARGNALLLPEAIGRKNLTRDFAAQRYEGRLGCAPWQACG